MQMVLVLGQMEMERLKLKRGTKKKTLRLSGCLPNFHPTVVCTLLSCFVQINVAFHYG